MRENREDQACSIRKTYKGQQVVDGAGVRINRIIGSQRLNYIDPFVLLDEIRSTDPDDYIAGFPTHPHRGIETITYMLHGSFRHRDSRGGGGLLTDGCIQWMTAGKGILHSEMPEAVKGEACGYQLWLNLPARQKMVEPRYQHLSPEMIPAVRKQGLTVRVISGRFEDMEGPAKNYVRSHYFDVEMAAGVSFIIRLDAAMNAIAYVHSGQIRACPADDGNSVVKDRTLVEFTQGTRIEIQAVSETARLLFFAAVPNNEPIARGGPFVMNTEEEIRQAFRDYETGVLG